LVVVVVALVKANWREREREREKCAYKENCMNFACSSLHTFEREREKGKKKKACVVAKLLENLPFEVARTHLKRREMETSGGCKVVEELGKEKRSCCKVIWRTSCLL